MNLMFRRSTLAFFPVAALAAACSEGVPSAEGTSTTTEAFSVREGALGPGKVFTQTNAADRNELVEYTRGRGGQFELGGHFDTGGAGLGTGLSAQGALARDGRWLFVVNAGSDDVSTFDLSSDPPKLASRVPAGGTMPVSVTARLGVVYVLDAGGAGNIAGFRVDAVGELHPIAGSTRPLSGAGVMPTEVAFAPDGDTLIVTEKGTNKLDAYYVDVRGRAEGPTVHASNGPAPFGFDFSPRGELIVSEAADSAASAYAIRDEVHLASISDSVPNTQKAACWLVVAPDGLHAFTANAASGTLSSYRITPSGELTLESAVAGQTGPESHPVDMAFASFGRTLYALANGAGTITAFHADSGDLAVVGSVEGLPTSTTGLVAW